MTISEAIPIVPYLLDRSIEYIKVFIDNFQLNSVDCTCSVYEYDKNDMLLNVHRVYIEPELYVEWGTNDTYIVDIVLDKLGYERKLDVPIIFPE